MKGAVETMMGILMLAWMAVFGTLYITASLNTQQAQRYHAAVVAEIEASGLADSVIESCKEQAIKNGYGSLDVKKIQTIYGYPCALVELDYRYTIPVLDLLLDHHIKGYAR